MTAPDDLSLMREALKSWGHCYHTDGGAFVRESQAALNRLEARLARLKRIEEAAWVLTAFLKTWNLNVYQEVIDLATALTATEEDIPADIHGL